MTTTPTTSAPPSAPAPFTPEPFGKYFLVDKIATGGMAEIFKAKTFSHGGFENLLVIKRILPHIGENSDFIEMFIDEAKVSVALQQPNIVRIYDFGKILDNYFIAMECVDGKDIRNVLRKLARRKEFLPPKFCAYVAFEVCKGLHYAHTKTDLQGNPYGIVHRDISPSNILISYEGEVKIADFGIAKAESNAYQTRDGMLKGKFEYMSPEQAQGKEIDHRSDLFSLGIILYEMMTGRRLFKTDSEIATLKRIREGEIAPPSKVKPDLPAALEAICMKALERDPEVRYRSAQELGDELREFLFPATSDTLRAEFREYLHGVFAEEIAEERARLESGGAIAKQLREKLPMSEWDGQPDSTMSQVTSTAVQYVVPWIAAIGLAMLGLFAAALVAVVYFVATNTGESTDQTVQTVPVDRTGIDIMVVPPSKISVDGTLRGEGQSLELEDLEPGTYLVRFDAVGFVSAEETVKVEAGQRVKLVKQLAAVAGPAPAAVEPAPSSSPSPSAPAGPPKVEFRSSPSGAAVFVEGNQVCTTPCTWDDAQLGKSYAIEMRAQGRESARSTLRDVKKGTNRVSLNLPEVSEPAKLTVTLVGGGWANVYVDGKKLAKTAPLKDWTVTPGPHEIRVENAALGIDVTEKHTFSGGQTVTIRPKAQ